MDDLTIHSKTIEDMFKFIQIVFLRLKDANLKLNWEKCVWFKKTVKLLGHVISFNCVRMDHDKIERILNWPVPTKILSLQGFLGMTNYYRRFVRSFAEIVCPLYNLLKKDIEWNWSKECNDSFIILRSKLASYPILRQGDFSREFIISTDACHSAIGGILGQKDINNQEYIVDTSSRLLKGAELHYSIS